MWRRLLDLALHLIWPVSCPVCGMTGEILCAECASAILRPALSRCLLCGGMFPCPRHPGAPRIRSASVYNDETKPLIISMKYGGFRAMAPRLGSYMARLWERPEADILLPVPLHIGSARGYNQAFEIARGLGGAWGIEAVDAAKWARRVPHRAGLSVDRRMTLHSGDFVVPRELAGLRVAIVDDVCTTGATMSRLAGACRAAGAEVVGAYVAAAPPYGKIDDNFS